MSVIAQYEVSVAAPSTVGGTGIGAIKYFSSNPPQALWNTGFAGVNTPQSSAQLGNTPSATSGLGQMMIYTASVGGQGKLLGNRFRVYASGVASSAVTPTFTPIVQVNKGTVSSVSYVTLMTPAAANTLVANQPVGWSLAGDFLLDPTSASIHGFMKTQYQSTATGNSNAVAEVSITLINGLTLTGAAGAAGFGLVAGVTFAGTSDASNSASLYEFKIVQD